MRQPYRAIAGCCSYQIIPLPVLMRICVPLYISTRPDSRRIRKNPFTKWTDRKRPGRWACGGKRAVCGAYALPIIESGVFIRTLVAHSLPDDPTDCSRCEPNSVRSGTPSESVRGTKAQVLRSPWNPDHWRRWRHGCL